MVSEETSVMSAQRHLRWTLALGCATLTLSGCGGGAIPAPAAPGLDRGDANGRVIVARSVEAHGGNLFEGVSDLSVSFAGEWGYLAARMQPVVADRRYRKASEERYLLSEGLIFQHHRGPAGEKKVVRRPGLVEVAYDGVVVDDQATRTSSALVADAYLMLSTGPSFFLRDGVELTALPPETLDGKTHEVVVARLRPGFGFSDEDRAQLWIDRDTGLLHRVRFTLEGFESTRGAEVDVTMTAHREIAGYLWPTRFVERIRRPVDVFAHRWSLVGLDIDRGLRQGDLTVGAISDLATAPARPVGSVLESSR